METEHTRRSYVNIRYSRFTRIGGNQLHRSSNGKYRVPSVCPRRQGTRSFDYPFQRTTEFLARYRPIPFFLPPTEIFPPSKKERSIFLFFHVRVSVHRPNVWDSSVPCQYQSPREWSYFEGRVKKGGIKERSGELEREYGGRGRGRASLFRLVRTASVRPPLWRRNQPPSVRHAFRILQTIITCAHVYCCWESWSVRDSIVFGNPKGSKKGGGEELFRRWTERLKKLPSSRIWRIYSLTNCKILMGGILKCTIYYFKIMERSQLWNSILYIYYQRMETNYRYL